MRRIPLTPAPISSYVRRVFRFRSFAAAGHETTLDAIPVPVAGPPRVRDLHSVSGAAHDPDELPQLRLSGAADPAFIGFGNYWEAIHRDPRAWSAFRNTLYFTLLFLPPYVLLPLPVAFLIDRLRRQTLMRVVTFLPVVVSGPVVAVLWVTFYDARGPLVALSKDLGFGQITLLGSPKTAMPALAAMSVWHGLGFNVLLYLVRLASIPSELYEAAAVDGARGIDVFWRITSRYCVRPSTSLPCSESSDR